MQCVESALDQGGLPSAVTLKRGLAEGRARNSLALFGAVHSQVLIHQDMVEEADQVDAERAEQGKRPEAQATIARAAALDRLLVSAEAQAATLGLDTYRPGGRAAESDS